MLNSPKYGESLDDFLVRSSRDPARSSEPQPKYGESLDSYLTRVSNDTSPTEPTPKPTPKPTPTLGQRFIHTLPALGQTILDQPTYIRGYIANVAEGTRPLASKNTFDKWADEANALQQERQTAPDAQDKTLFGTKADWANTAASIPFSLGSLAAAGAAGLGTSLATANPVAGYGAQALASGALAHRADSAMFVRQGLEAYTQKAQQEGRQPTDQELLAEQERLQPYAMQHGWAEAIPEAVGTPIAAGLLGKVFSGPAKGLGSRVIKAGVGVAGEELPTETITQQFQHNIESNAGVSDQPQRSMLSMADWGASLGEVAIPVLQQAALTGGAAGAGAMLYNKFTGKSAGPLTKALETGGINAENQRNEAIDRTGATGEPGATEPQTGYGDSLLTGTPGNLGISSDKDAEKTITYDGKSIPEIITPDNLSGPLTQGDTQNGKIESTRQRQGEIPTNARQETNALLTETAGEPLAPAFKSTHLLNDGYDTPVIQLDTNIYRDEDGIEWQDDNAIPINTNDEERIAADLAAQQQQQRTDIDQRRTAQELPEIAAGKLADEETQALNQNIQEQVDETNQRDKVPVPAQSAAGELLPGETRQDELSTARSNELRDNAVGRQLDSAVAQGVTEEDVTTPATPLPVSAPLPVTQKPEPISAKTTPVTPTERLPVTETPKVIVNERTNQPFDTKSQALAALSSKTAYQYATPATHTIQADEQGKSVIVPKSGVEIADVSSTPDSYVQARKEGQNSKLFFVGTRNDVFPGAVFDSTTNARNFFKATKDYQNSQQEKLSEQKAQEPLINENKSLDNKQLPANTQKNQEQGRPLFSEPLTETPLVQKNATPEEKNTAETSRAETGKLTPTAAKESLTEEPLLNEAKTESTFKGMPIEEVPLNKITLSKEVPQFKANANKNGIVEPITGKFERTGVAPVQ